MRKTEGQRGNFPWMPYSEEGYTLKIATGGRFDFFLESGNAPPQFFPALIF